MVRFSEHGFNFLPWTGVVMEKERTEIEKPSVLERTKKVAHFLLDRYPIYSDNAGFDFQEDLLTDHSDNPSERSFY